MFILILANFLQEIKYYKNDTCIAHAYLVAPVKEFCASVSGSGSRTSTWMGGSPGGSRQNQESGPCSTNLTPPPQQRSTITA